MFPISKELSNPEVDWEDITLAKNNAKVVPVTMIMDVQGAIFFLMQYEDGTVKVIRNNLQAEMGEEKFF